ALTKKYLETAPDADQKAMEEQYRASGLFSSFSPEQQQEGLTNKEYWEFWLAVDRNTKVATNTLKLSFHDPGSYDDFLKTVERQLRQDRPVLVSVVYARWDEQRAPPPGRVSEREPYATPVIEVRHKSLVRAGHYQVIVG